MGRGAEGGVGNGVSVVLCVLPVSAVQILPLTRNHSKFRFGWGKEIGPYRTWAGD